MPPDGIESDGAAVARRTDRAIFSNSSFGALDSDPRTSQRLSAIITKPSEFSHGNPAMLKCPRTDADSQSSPFWKPHESVSRASIEPAAKMPIPPSNFPRITTTMNLCVTAVESGLRSNSFRSTALAILMWMMLGNSSPHCLGTTKQWLSCDAISAQAAIDQAHDADKQAGLLWWQFGLGALTLGAAAIAAWYARGAALHTQRAADAALAANRPWISLSIEDTYTFSMTEDHVLLVLKVSAANRGNPPATNVMAFAALSGDVERANKLAFTPDCNLEARRIGGSLGHGLTDLGLVIAPGEEKSQTVAATLLWADFIERWGFRPESVLLDTVAAATYQFGGQGGYSEVGARLIYKDSPSPAFPTKPREFEIGEYELSDNATGMAS